MTPELKSDVVETHRWPAVVGLVLLVVHAAAICVFVEFVRQTWPQNGEFGGRWFTLVYLSSVRAILVTHTLGLMLHRACALHFRSRWWRDPLLFIAAIIGSSALLAVVIAVVCFYRVPTITYAWDYAALTIYTYLGMYWPGTAPLLICTLVGVATFHVLRHSWRHGNRLAAFCDLCLKHELSRRPDGRLLVAIDTIHWDVFGHAAEYGREKDQELILPLLRDCLVTDAKTMADRRRAQTSKWIRVRAPARRGKPRPLSEADCRLARLARYLTIPRNSLPHLSGLLEAAECYFLLQITGLPEDPTGEYWSFADSANKARRMETEIYKHLLEDRKLKRNPPARSCGVLWDAFLFVYKGACRLWHGLPESLRCLVRIDARDRETPNQASLTDEQRSVLRFIVQPTAHVDDLLAALPKTLAADNDAQRLTWLAIAKWLREAQMRGRFAHEAVVDGHVRLRYELLRLWIGEPIFESRLRAQANLLEAWYLLQIGAAWIRYHGAITELRVNGECVEFARALSANNLHSPEAMSLLGSADHDEG